MLNKDDKENRQPLLPFFDQSDKEDGSPPRKKKIPGWLWWLVALVLITWNIMAFLPGNQALVSIPYTSFLDQVKADNVSAVDIEGDQITGQLKKAIIWPQPTPSPVASQAQSTPGAPESPTVTAPPTATPGSVPATQVSLTYFQTNFPTTIGDAVLMPLLVQHKVQVTSHTQSVPWYSWLLSVLFSFLPFLLLIGFMLYMGRQTLRGQSGLLDFSRTKARRYGSGNGEKPDVSFQDVAGADEAKDDLREVVDFLKVPDKYRRLGAHMPHGILLVGPPGTGKTLLAKAVAGEAQVPFFSISGSEFVEMFVGVGASRVRDLFGQARTAAPAIVFIDELDAVGRRRGAGLGNVNDEREQTLNQLLVAIDGFEENQAVVVLAATNRPDVLDPALLRPGRFDRQVVMELPDRFGREAILKIHSRSLPLAPDVDLAGLAGNTTGLSGADLANLCNEAALQAAQHNHDMVTAQDFEEALDKTVLGEKRKILLSQQDRTIIAYHESGHALVGWFTPLADPVRRVTLIPHGRALGATEQRPVEDRYNYSRSYLMARLTVMLGGRASEELVFGEVTTGAENDLVEATKLVRRMVTEWGMSPVGLTALENDAEQPFLGYELAQGRHYSEAMAAQVDREIKHMLDERYKSARQILEEHRDKLDSLVSNLLKEDTIYQEGLETILGPRPVAQTELEVKETAPA
ncbi:MAG TPA: ATP-dependent zinc metalloprotease FtsH [Chloroflexia bacterium]|nr:ATP-dependent zinc metalloprotease FtsH [Chloroflexia bacterium]